MWGSYKIGWLIALSVVIIGLLLHAIEVIFNIDILSWLNTL